jgi:zinc transport system permease protein
MTDFFAAVGRYPFLQYALAAGILASVAGGVVGTFVVTRRISYIGGGIAHSLLGGLGAAYYIQIVYEQSWLHPIFGAAVAAVIAAVIIGWVSLRARQREDTVIGAIWAIGMALGILFISQTPGYSANLMSYLFGNILMVGATDVLMIAILDAVVIGTVVLFYNQLQAVCFDEEFARVRGINVEFYYLLLLILTALTVVILVSVVGIIMVIALLTLPAAVASLFARTLKGTMIYAAILGITFTIAGLAISYGPGLPAGATIILLAGVVYIVSSLLFGRNSR